MNAGPGDGRVAWMEHMISHCASKVIFCVLVVRHVAAGSDEAPIDPALCVYVVFHIAITLPVASKQ